MKSTYKIRTRRNDYNFVIDYAVMVGDEVIGTIEIEPLTRSKDGTWKLYHRAYTGDYPNTHTAKFDVFQDAVEFILLHYT